MHVYGHGEPDNTVKKTKPDNTVKKTNKQRQICIDFEEKSHENECHKDETVVAA